NFSARIGRALGLGPGLRSNASLHSRIVLRAGRKPSASAMAPPMLVEGSGRIQPHDLLASANSLALNARVFLVRYNSLAPGIAGQDPVARMVRRSGIQNVGRIRVISSPPHHQAPSSVPSANQPRCKSISCSSRISEVTTIPNERPDAQPTMG